MTWSDNLPAAPPQPSADEVVVRTGIFFGVLLTAGGGLLLLICLFALTPFAVRHDPVMMIAPGVAGVFLTIGGIAWIKSRRPQVYLSSDELRMPGWGIERLAWTEIVSAESIQLHVGGSAQYLGLNLVPGALARIHQPKVLKVQGLLAKMMSLRLKHYDLMLNVDTIEWSAEKLADAINARVAAATEAAPYDDESERAAG